MAHRTIRPNLTRDTSTSRSLAIMAVTQDGNTTTKASMYYDANAQKNLPYFGNGTVPKAATMMTVAMNGDDQFRVGIGYGGYTTTDSHNSEA